jgi:serine/threonine protein kinase/Tfp pilus assembly protein PilF
MEYVPGEDLRSSIRRFGQLPIGKSISIAKQICEGLTEAHRLGVVHRDLKSNNIMIDKQGDARIMDFGIARSLEAKRITGAGVMIGTPEYMSPEQVEGKEIDQRSDIYSLGVILYEMLTGKVPFEGDTPFIVGMKHKGEMPQNPKELNAQISEDLNNVILKCLEKDKEKRFRGAGEVLSELENIERALPTTERIVTEKKPLTSKEITVTFGLKKLFIPTFILAALVIMAIIIWQVLPSKEAIQETIPTSTPKPSIAVLPFADLSPQKDQESFCDGMANSIITALSNLGGLSVRASGSSFAFKGQNLTLKEIGKRLNVETVLDGQVQKAEDRIRLTAQLTNIADESVLWSGTYDKKLEDIFAIQDEITQAIVDNLELKLLGAEETKLKKRHTENVQAFSHYSNGLFYWNKRTGEGIRKAIEFFEQAIEEDPDYALAYVGLADCYNLLGTYSDVRSAETFPKAQEAANKALEIDENLGEAHNSLAYVKSRYNLDFDGAENEFKRGIELNPGYATGRFWYGEFLTLMGRFDEAIEEMKKAIELDPISLIINASLGWSYMGARQYDQALAQLKKAEEMDPDFQVVHLYFGFLYINLENYAEAIRRLEKAKELSSNSVVSLSNLGYAYAKAGKTDEAKRILTELESISKERYVSPFFWAGLYLGFGDKEKALDYLEQEYEARGEFLIFLNMGNLFGPIRSEPRFQDLLKKIGLEQK